MASKVVMPQMGYDMREGHVVKWLKKEGEQINKGEILAEIQTDKAVVEFESLASGLVRKIVVSEGDVVPVGTIIAVIGEESEDISSFLSDAPSNESVAEEKPTSKPVEKQPVSQKISESNPGTVKASPVAKRLAKEKGINLADVKGTGPSGRIVEKDVVEFNKSASSVSSTQSVSMEDSSVQLSKMRQAVAKVTTNSKQNIPHFYVTMEIDMTESMKVRKQLNQELEGQFKISVNDLIIKAVCKSLEKHQKLNASFENEQLNMHSAVNMGIAIALEEGLIIPNIPNSNQKSLVDISAATSDIVKRAQEGKIRAEEYTGSTFTISNLGMYGVDDFTAIIFPPNAAVLAVGSVSKKPIVKGEEITISEIMSATISVDHRVADGAEAAKFLADVRRYLESPSLLLL